MENRVKQKKFVSLVLYLHNAQNEVVPFFQKVLPVFRDNFTNFEIVCVNDACTDGTIGVLKEYLEENHCSGRSILFIEFFSWTGKRDECGQGSCHWRFYL